jgi:hypothetical protein
MTDFRAPWIRLEAMPKKAVLLFESAKRLSPAPKLSANGKG